MQSLLVGLCCNFILVIVLTGIVAVPAFIDCSPTICYNEIFASRFLQYFEDAAAGRTCPRYDYSYAANLFTSLSEFIKAARAMTAVPCWSSWNTGIGSSFCKIGRASCRERV